jgi:hypothetical protein
MPVTVFSSLLSNTFSRKTSGFIAFKRFIFAGLCHKKESAGNTGRKSGRIFFRRKVGLQKQN